MKFSIRFLSSILIPLFCANANNNVLAAPTEKIERWFEVEVILFKQLSDKKLLKEQFTGYANSTKLPQYQQYFDLLTTYVHPNITGIKQFIPLCSENMSQNTFVKSQPTIDTPPSSALKVIEQLDTFKVSALTTDAMNMTNATSISNSTKNVSEVLSSPLFSPNNICVVSQKDVETLFSDDRKYNFPLNSFDVKALPEKLNAAGTHVSHSPYLIADESLLLSDIQKHLQRSKEFKPLLHFGWRQVGVTKSKATPLKLIAGKHFSYQYQQALTDYSPMLAQVKSKEQTDQLSYQHLTTVAHDKNNSAKTRQQLSQVFNDIESIDDSNINGLITELEQQNFDAFITVEQSNIGGEIPVKSTKAPEEPLQPWFLDGFLKVHLDHYLYITADFNILAQAFDDKAEHGADTASTKLINFSQNKRAITGEIHYFDHPYIGMLVQIRRFDPSKPKDEAVTQVVN